MAYYTIADAREAFRRRQSQIAPGQSAIHMLQASGKGALDLSRSDILLSHSLKDAALLVGIKAILEDQGFSVRLNWTVEEPMVRSEVMPEMAERIRRRMRLADSMLFVTEDHYPNAKWAAWELGYFEGVQDGRVALLPLVQAQGAHFDAREYFALYPVVEHLDGTSYVSRGDGSRSAMTMRAFIKGSRNFTTY
jgi:hypothetical protein